MKGKRQSNSEICWRDDIISRGNFRGMIPHLVEMLEGIITFNPQLLLHPSTRVYLYYHVLNSGTPIEISTNQATPIFSHIAFPWCTHAYMINTLHFEYVKSSDRRIGTSAAGTRANTTNRLS